MMNISGLSRWKEVSWQEIACAVRSLKQSPGLTATIVVMLGLGLGASASVFSILDRVFFKLPDGVERPAEVVRVYATQTYRGDAGEFTRGEYNYPEALGIQRAIGPALVSTVYVGAQSRPIGSDDGSGSLFVTYVDGAYFKLLGVEPAAGRLFEPDEAEIASPAPVVVLNYRYWRSHFGGDSSVIGRRLSVRGEAYRIIGVAGKTFTGVSLNSSDVWLPLGAYGGIGTVRHAGQPWYERHGSLFLNILVRAPTLGARQFVATRGAAALRDADAWNAGLTRSAVVQTGSLLSATGPTKVRPEFATALRLEEIAMVLLVISCCNVGNLLLARAVRRRRDIGMRLALGISRGRLIGMAMAEMLVLVSLAGTGAVVVGAWGGDVLREFLVPAIHWPGSAFGARLLVLTVLLTICAGVVLTAIPVVIVSRTTVASAFRAGALSERARRLGIRTALVAGQIALAALLVMTAEVLIRSLENVEVRHTGYDAEYLLFVTARLPGALRTSAASVLHERLPLLAERLGAAPGVEGVALVDNLPMQSISFAHLFTVAGDSLPERDSDVPVYYSVSPTFFAVAGTRIVRGRGFENTDDASGARVMLVNEQMARRYWPGEEPIGQCIRVGEPANPCYTVIGVAEDVRVNSLVEAPKSVYYFPLAQSPDGAAVGNALIVRTDPRRLSTVAANAGHMVLAVVHGSVPDVQAMSAILEPQLRPWRVAAVLSGVLGILAAAVATLGVYASASYAFAQRTREMAIRLALGSTRGEVVGLLLRQAMATAVIAVIVGLFSAEEFGHAFGALLYGVSTHDPVAIGITATVLLATASMATIAPAIRVAGLDPAQVLRELSGN